jgi:hypothetical protein
MYLSLDLLWLVQTGISTWKPCLGFSSVGIGVIAMSAFSRERS